MFSEPVTALQVFSLSGLGLIGLTAVPPIRKSKHLKQALILGIVVLCVFSIGYFVGTISAQTGTITVEPGSFAETASYVVWTDGTYVYAKNGKTGAIEFSGTDAASVIQSALNALTSGRTWKEKVVLKGEFVLNSMINLTSYLHLELQGSLKLANNKDVTMLYGAGLTHLEISGGIMDGNSPNQTPPPTLWGLTKGAIIGLDNCTNVIIRDIFAKNARLWALWLERCENFVVSNINFDTGVVVSDGVTGRNQDGLHIVSCRRGVINGLYGIVGDEFFGVSANYAKGETSEIVATNIAGKSRSGHMVYLRPADENAVIRDVSMSNVATKDVGISAIRIFAIYSGAVVKHVTINGVNVEGWGSCPEDPGGPAVHVYGSPGLIEKIMVEASVGTPSSLTSSTAVRRYSVQVYGARDSVFQFRIYDVKSEARGLDIVNSDRNVFYVSGDYVNTNKTLWDFIRLTDSNYNRLYIDLRGGLRGVYLAGTSTHNIIRGSSFGATSASIAEASTADYNDIRFCQVDMPISKAGSNTIVKDNIGYDTENFKVTGVSISVGTGGAYGSASAVQTPSGRVTYPRVKITWGGTFGTGETVTVKVEAVYTDGSTAYIEKSATTTGSLWLTDDDIISLITQGKDIVKLNVYAKTNLSSTTVTVTVDAYGKA
jgi:hypothetical protein